MLQTPAHRAAATFTTHRVLRQERQPRSHHFCRVRPPHSGRLQRARRTHGSTMQLPQHFLLRHVAVAVLRPPPRHEKQAEFQKHVRHHFRSGCEQRTPCWRSQLFCGESKPSNQDTRAVRVLSGTPGVWGKGRTQYRMKHQSSEQRSLRGAQQFSRDTNSERGLCQSRAYTCAQFLRPEDQNVSLLWGFLSRLCRAALSMQTAIARVGKGTVSAPQGLAQLLFSSRLALQF